MPVVESITLTVAEAPESDVGLGRARIDTKSRLALGVDVGDIVEIIGKKNSAAKIASMKPEEEGKGILCVDGFVRRNIGVSLGDRVEIKKAEVFTAERVTIAPIISEGHKIAFGQGIENFVKIGLLKRPLVNGDVVIVPGIAPMGGALPFMVTEVVPTGIAQVTENTILDLQEKAVREGGGPSHGLLFNRVIIDVADLARSIHFYGDLLGFYLLPRGSGQSGRETARLGGLLGMVAIELRRISHPVTASEGIVLGFQVADLDEVCRELRSAGIEVIGPEEGATGSREAHVRDPDGHRIVLFSPDSFGVGFL